MNLKITFDCTACHNGFRTKVVKTPYDLCIDSDHDCPNCGTEGSSYVLMIEEAKYKEYNFSLEGLNGTYRGYSNGERLNNNLLPLFELKEMMRILNVLHNNQYDNSIMYDHNLSSMVEDDKFLGEKFEYPIIDIEVNGKEIRVCGLGGGKWLWQKE